ncbi:hypothetical protein C0993_001885 [Termitomyces sp. T159_Od127]|nr:hypothetical protein C0993_001885 [Termitomyces sp. T159_Od127]
MAAVCGLSPVEYEREDYTGPEHDPRWTSTVGSNADKASAAAKALLASRQLNKL